MKVTILGSGAVGQALATRVNELGHEVCMATRDPEITRSRTEPNPFNGISFSAWHAKNPEIRLCAFPEVSPDTDLLVNATAGMYSLEALEAVGAAALSGKTLLDVANPLDFTRGFPPSLTVCNTDSLGEQIQRRYPDSHVVKALNTLNFNVMVTPELVPGEHQVFLCGNDAGAKRQVSGLLQEMGWPAHRILDLGGIESSRGTEMLMPMTFSLMGALGSPIMNYHIERP
jgi:predicted dinucleotide-binding enzyme